jgi:predicted metalloprotease with PDZ domain
VRGFTGQDIERTVAEVCGCAVRSFFDAHVRAAKPIDFDRYLGLIGLRTRVSWSPALERDGQPAVDYRIFAWLPPGEDALSLLLTDPKSEWGRAGQHTGDRLVAVNGSPMTNWTDFRTLLRGLRIGDTVHFEVKRPAGARRTRVVVTGYNRPSVRIEEIPEATEPQRAMRERWLRGTMDDK